MKEEKKIDLCHLNNEQLLQNANRAILREFLYKWSQTPKTEIEVENWLNATVRFGIFGEDIYDSI